MLSLTDMWRAAGSLHNKRPNAWLRTDFAKEFISFVADNLKCEDMRICQTRRGRDGGGSWAHWQVAMAYAKYLSPEFHMWCNTVVRAHMEGTTVEPERTYAGPIQDVLALEAALIALSSSW